MAARTFRKKKQQQSRAFLCSHYRDNRERARAKSIYYASTV